MFNLRQLMQLEQERLIQEQAQREAEHQAEERIRIERELRVLEETAAAAAEERAAVLRTRAQIEAQERAETERQAALLRVQLEAAAVERARQSERQEGLERARAQLSRWRARAVACCVVAAVSSGILAYFATASGAATASSGRGAASNVAVPQSHEQASEIAALRRQLAELLSARPAPATTEKPQPTATPDTSHAASGPKRRGTPANPGLRAGTKPRASADLDDLGDERDPIGGLHL